MDVKVNWVGEVWNVDQSDLICVECLKTHKDASLKEPEDGKTHRTCMRTNSEVKVNLMQCSMKYISKWENLGRMLIFFQDTSPHKVKWL